MMMHVEEAEAYLLANRDMPFVDLVRCVGLDPATHFRYSDLSGADFGNQDLDRFDFTGATLLGCNFDRATLGRVVLDGARYEKAALYLAVDFDPAFGFADADMDRALFRAFLDHHHWSAGLGRRLIDTSGLISAIVVLRRYLERNRDIAAAQVEELADALAPDDAFYLAESAATRLRQDLVRWGRGHSRTLDEAAERFQKLVVPAKESTRVYLDNLMGVASAIEFFGVLAIAGRLGVATNAVRSHELLSRLDGPRWNSPPLATSDWNWMIGQYSKAMEAGAPFRCDDLLPLLQTASSPHDVIDAFAIMSRHGLLPTMRVLRAASLPVSSAKASSLHTLLSRTDIESSLGELRSMANAERHADEIVAHFTRFIEPTAFRARAGRGTGATGPVPD